MIVLYPVLVLSIIAGNGLVFADGDAPKPAPVPAPASAADAAAEAVNTTTAAPAKTDPPPNLTEAPKAKDPPAPEKVEVSKTNTNDNDDAPMADNYSYENVDKAKLASTLDRITKVLDASPTPAKGTAAVPLLPGKNYDFFLLKVPKHGEEPEKATEKPQKLVGRNLDLSNNENALNYPATAAVVSPVVTQPCPCVQPPPQIAPDLTTLQGIFGNALSMNTVLDPGCPPGTVPVVPSLLPNSMMSMRMLPAIDGIPVNGLMGNALDFNTVGLYNQYSQNSLPNYQQPAPSYYPLQNSYSAPSISVPYPQGTASLPFSYPQSGALPFAYPLNVANFPVSYPQNGYNPSQIQPYQPYDPAGIVPYGQSQVNAPYALSPFENFNNPFQTQQSLYPSQMQPVSPDFPGSFSEYNKRNEYKSAKSLYRIKVNYILLQHPELTVNQIAVNSDQYPNLILTPLSQNPMPDDLKSNFKKVRPMSYLMNWTRIPQRRPFVIHVTPANPV